MVVYKTTNLINHKFYIGQDGNNNSKYFGSGLLIKKAIDKYGEENFIKEILEECYSKKELDIRERYWIKKLDANNRDIAYNIGLGGDGGDTLTNHPDLEEIKLRISESNKGRDAWNKGLVNVYSEEHINCLKKSREKYTGENHPRYIQIDSDELKNVFEKNSFRKTAKHFNVSVGCIQKKIKEFNIKK